jgi:hypothetical protein
MQGMNNKTHTENIKEAQRLLILLHKNYSRRAGEKRSDIYPLHVHGKLEKTRYDAKAYAEANMCDEFVDKLHKIILLMMEPES